MSEIIIKHIEDWPNVSNIDPDLLETVVEPFKELLSINPERLECLGKPDDYYIGQIKDGQPHGLGMQRENFPASSEGYKQMTVEIGHWKEGRLCGEGVFHSM